VLPRPADDYLALCDLLFSPWFSDLGKYTAS
jgi:hypothetical protein